MDLAGRSTAASLVTRARSAKTVTFVMREVRPGTCDSAARSGCCAGSFACGRRMKREENPREMTEKRKV